MKIGCKEREGWLFFQIDKTHHVVPTQEDASFQNGVLGGQGKMQVSILVFFHLRRSGKGCFNVP